MFAARPAAVGPNAMEPDPAPGPARGSAHISHALGLDLCGLVLDGRYQVIRRIGAGGMASVYEARRVGLERRFAVKILRPELAENESNIKRFLREARAAASVQHANIVSIEDVGGATVPVYFVMEYLEGVDLRQELKRIGRFDWLRTQDLALQIVDALAAAHQIGIVHRDVKPANCFLTRDPTGAERMKVLDFGIAKVLEESQEFTQNVTATHGIVGTVAYMAPEQARSGTVDARTDVYAMGTMLYEMLAGTVPFADKNPFVVIGRLLGEMPVPLRMHRPDLPSELDALVMTCLEKDPDARFQSMEALGNAIASCHPDGAVVGTAKVRLPSGLLRAAKTPPAAARPAATAPITPAPATTAADEPSPAGPTALLPDRSTGRARGSIPQLPTVDANSTTTAPRRRPASNDTALLGVLIGGVGMLALGGTATWWALHTRGDRDGDVESTAPADPGPSPAAVGGPPVVKTVIVPIPGESPASAGTSTAEIAPPAGTAFDSPSEAPSTDPRTRKRPTKPAVALPSVLPATPPSTTPPAATPQPRVEPSPPETPRGPNISPDLRNPFGRGKQ